tara:strand:+ start:811 stop:1992 length:1182 start_codon:yes stop_codon:yes gene_type:complete
MAIWGKTSGAESRPKSLPMDSNSSYSREFVNANAKGWVFQPGTASAATGNDNASADPEILVAIRNLSVTFKSGNLLSIDYTAGAYADASDFDLILTFDEAMTVTSAAATANNTITNKVYITLSELGATDMVQDNTVNCQYKSGSGTNTLTFRGRLNTTDAGYLGFTDGFIHVNGTATMQSDDETFSGILSETDGGQSDDSIVLDASSGASGTIAGALTASTTVTVDGVSGTIAVGQIVTVSGAGSTPAASITATEDGDTGISTDNTLTITAVEDQTEFTVSEPITVADNVNLLFSADAGEGIEQNSVSMEIEGADGATSVIGTQSMRTGFGVDTLDGRVSMLEDGSGKLINETDGTDGFAAEEFTVDADGLILATQSGSASGSATILNGVTTA